ncbi:FadR/GntR family transcriptional regulator [Allofournierella sp.]|uniref:FadR/GntR family transcriptional regulator n=1 Tax=Allofournierella sp. TaxID=1940256 RepID=UPI003AB38BD3
MEFARLSAPSLKELFVQQVRDKILAGELSVGSRLPPERELARQMQVSRAVVNGGVAELARQGFLELRPRQGTFVADYRRSGNMDTLIAIMDYKGGIIANSEIRAILEVRRALEHLACELAIDCASDEDLAGLGAIVDELGRAETPGEAARIAFRFQHELAFVGGNSILPLIYYSFRSPVITLWERFCSRHSVEALYRNASTLLEHMRGRDKAAVSRWIDQYLNEAIRGSRQIYGR